MRAPPAAEAGEARASCRSLRRFANSSAPAPVSSRDRRIDAREPLLSAIREMWIGRGDRARRIERDDLIRRQAPTDRAEVLAKLLLIARADDDGGNRRPLDQPVERDLRRRPPLRMCRRRSSKPEPRGRSVRESDSPWHDPSNVMTPTRPPTRASAGAWQANTAESADRMARRSAAQTSIDMGV